MRSILKLGLTLLVIVVLLIPLAGTSLATAQSEAISATEPFAVGVPSDGKSNDLPKGSTVYHKADGTTVVISADNKIVCFANDEDAATINTPGGPVKATHVFNIPNDSVVKDAGDGTRIYFNGELLLTIVDETVDSCLTDEEDKVVPNPEDTWWIVYTKRFVDEVTYFRAKWEVPDSPPDPGDGAVDFVFNAIQSDDEEADILQPVLEWNHDESGRWTCAAWVGLAGDFLHAPDFNVNEGQLVNGLLDYNKNTGRWLVLIFRSSPYNYSAIYVEGCDYEDYQVSCTLEGWDIWSDDDVPGDITFYSILFKDYDGDTFTVNWQEVIPDGWVPDILSYLGTTIYGSSSVKLKTAN